MTLFDYLSQHPWWAMYHSLWIGTVLYGCCRDGKFITINRTDNSKHGYNVDSEVDQPQEK